MANLRGLESTPNPGDGVTYSGTVVLDGAGKLAVNVQGNPIYPRYADPVVVAVGDPVTVVINGTGDAVVTGRVTLQPRPAEGVVKTVPPGSPTITVTGTDGIDYTAKFAASYTPTVNDNVLLAWNASFPYVTAKVGVVAAVGIPSTGVAPPPGPDRAGQTPFTASDSATWVPGLGAWDSWAGGGGNVFQGSQGGYTTYGSWFYAGSLAQLSGRIWTRIQFTLGSRRAVGTLNDPITLHVYAHTSANRPGGDVTRTTGPFDVTIQPFAGQQTFDLPTTFAGALAAGGGISIAGDPYAGFNGRLIEPASGQLLIDWLR
jgi:hypothetical protein